MSKKIVFIGASGHGKVLADIAAKNGYAEIVFLDDNAEVKSCGQYPVVGTSKDSDTYADCDFFVSIGSPNARERIQNMLEEKGFSVATLIHPNAVVADSTVLGKGTAVMAGAVINPDAVLGKGCIVNTCASVDHDCTLLDFVHVAVGAHVAGTVQIGARTWIGAGVTVSNNVNICSDCLIGAGAVVVKDITEGGTYIGVPARKK